MIPLLMLNRFQGGVLGCLLGRILAAQHQNNQPNLTQGKDWLKVTRNLTRSLIDYGQLSQDDWQQMGETLPDSSSVLALVTLPLTLLFYDRPGQLQQQLEYLTHSGAKPQEKLGELLLWQDTIALILKEKIKTRPLLAQLLERHSQKQHPLRQQLETVQSLIEERRPLKEVPHPLGLAIYCFSYTRDDFQLSLLRARQTNYQLELTLPLTGMLAGVYNGTTGIPIIWHLELQKLQDAQEMLQEATELFALWAGISPPLEYQLLPDTAIAPRGVMQPRLGFKVISEQ